MPSAPLTGLARRPPVPGSWLSAFAVALALGAGLVAGPQPDDDAFITLRYARSIAEGDGFVFNPGERVLGTTTPLFAVLLAAAHRVTSLDLVWLAYALALLAHAAAVVMILRVGRACRAEYAGGLAACLYALAPVALRPTVGCMETSLFVLATLYALAPSSSPNVVARSIAAGAAMLLRPEGAITATMLLLDGAVRGAKTTARTVRVIGLLVLPWVLFATWYFGNPLPQSLVVKWSYHGFMPPLLAAENFWYLLLTLPSAAPMIDFGGRSAPFGAVIAAAFSWPGSAAIRRIIVLAVGSGVLLIGAAGALRLYRRNARMLALLLFTGGYILAYCAAHPYIQSWYVTPPLPMLLLAFVVGGAAGIDRLCSDPWSRRAKLATAGAMLGLALWQSGRLIRSFPVAREAGYRRAVEMIGPLLAPSSTMTIGALEIGTIGYYSRARIVDHFGLVSPLVPQLGTAGTIERYRPDFYIGQDKYFAFLGFSKVPAFVENYDLLARLPAGTSQEPATLIYIRHRANDARQPPVAR